MSEILSLGQVGVPPALPPEPNVLDLEDMLYDILASGADPNLPPGTLEAVQTFLHEHARSKRSLPEFVAFFASHKLSMVRDTGFGLSLPPVELRAPMRSSRSAPEPEFEPTRAAAPVPRHVEPDPIEVAPVAPERGEGYRRALALWASAAAVLAAISGGALYAAISARDELEQVRAEQRATAAVMAQMQTEVVRLRGTVDQNAQISRNVDHKTELLLRTLVSPLDIQQR
ncbi:MAG TPA: hypothetical protein VFG30_44225 [Polyangiales bacterium]|nr:hypothetical protein [Polyangiales bacterium]